MGSVRGFELWDLFKFGSVNLDALTETFDIRFYGGYIARWPELTVTAETAMGAVMGYFLGKVEGSRGDEIRKDWHGHVTAVTVAPQYRKLGLARSLMDLCERVSDRLGCFFVDLFVRPSNDVAVGMYKKRDYIVYREVASYYSKSGPGTSEEDAYDMRKALSSDPDKSTL